MPCMEKRTFKTKLKNFAFAVCGWLFLWVVLVNVVGGLLFSGFHSEGSCVPYIGVFWVFETHKCPNKILEPILYWLVGMPRFYTVPVFMFFAGIYADWHEIIVASLYEIYETPLFFLFLHTIVFLFFSAIGTLYWYKKNPYFSLIMLFSFIITPLYIEIIYLF